MNSTKNYHFFYNFVLLIYHNVIIKKKVLKIKIRVYDYQQHIEYNIYVERNI